VPVDGIIVVCIDSMTSRNDNNAGLLLMYARLAVPMVS
jgi:hypothetical protein